MHFHPRDQVALRSVGLSTEGLRTAAGRAHEAVDEEATALEHFFELTLGPTVHDRVRFAPAPEAL